jgi:hypothetical protein
VLGVDEFVAACFHVLAFDQSHPFQVLPTPSWVRPFSAAGPALRYQSGVFGLPPNHALQRSAAWFLMKYGLDWHKFYVREIAGVKSEPVASANPAQAS